MSVNEKLENVSSTGESTPQEFKEVIATLDLLFQDAFSLPETYTDPDLPEDGDFSDLRKDQWEPGLRIYKGEKGSFIVHRDIDKNGYHVETGIRKPSSSHRERIPSAPDYKIEIWRDVLWGAGPRPDHFGDESVGTRVWAYLFDEKLTGETADLTSDDTKEYLEYCLSEDDAIRVAKALAKGIKDAVVHEGYNVAAEIETRLRLILGSVATSHPAVLPQPPVS